MHLAHLVLNNTLLTICMKCDLILTFNSVLSDEFIFGHPVIRYDLGGIGAQHLTEEKRTL